MLNLEANNFGEFLKMAKMQMTVVFFGFNNNVCASGRWVRGKMRCSCQEPRRVCGSVFVGGYL